MFPDILVSDQTRRQLEGIAAKPSHAVLICGEEHLGKHLMARALAARLLSTSIEELEKSSAFRELSALKGTISIETVRAILPFFSLLVPGREVIKRVVLIPDADAMTHAAQNALLKVLEEPPADTVILLTSSHLDRLLPTIRSRCQLCRVKKSAETDTRQYLQGSYSEAKTKNALLVGGGTIGGAKLVLEAEGNDTDALHEAKSFLGQPLFEQLLAVDAYSKDREEAVRFVALLVTIAEKGLLHSRSPQWQKILQATLTADAALKKNANIKLVLTELALSLR
jgi:DNA polymerase III delta subunit